MIEFPEGLVARPKSTDTLTLSFGNVRFATLIGLVALVAASCADEAPSAEQANGAVLCGAAGEFCCVGPSVPCGVQLRCDEAKGLCVHEDLELDTVRLCADTSDCAVGQTCCRTGNLGSCVPRESECALPDLALTSNLNPFVDMALVTAGYSTSLDQWHSAEPRAANSCALEKQCLPAAGIYKLLRFSTQVVNLGTAALILGAPGAPGVELAACDGLPYLENFLRYELFDASGARVADGHGRAPAKCLSSRRVRNQQGLDPNLAAAETTARFNCEFLGMEAQGALSYDFAEDCQWLEIGGLPPGNYRLRLTVNPDQTWPESNHGNNTLELPVTLPGTLDPLTPCPTPPDPMVLPFSTERDCGWSAVPAASCTPGEPVQFGCATCEGPTLLRVCEGRAPCTADAQLANAESVDASNRCPTAHFTCPPSGAFSGVVGVYDTRNGDADVACDARPL